MHQRTEHFITRQTKAEFCKLKMTLFHENIDLL